MRDVEAALDRAVKAASEAKASAMTPMTAEIRSSCLDELFMGAAEMSDREAAAAKLIAAAMVRGPEPPRPLKPQELAVVPDKGKVKGRGNATKLLLTAVNIDRMTKLLGWCIHYDEMGNTVLTNLLSGLALGRTHLSKVITSVRDLLTHNQVSEKYIKDYLGEIAADNPVNPVRDWLRSQQWDGRSRFSELEACLVLDPARSGASNRPLRKLFVRVLMIEACAAADMCMIAIEQYGYRRQMDMVPILQGRQGLLKSAFFATLVPQHLRHYFSSVQRFKLEDKDAVLDLAGLWIAEFGEIERVLKRDRDDDLKEYLSRDSDRCRRPWGHDTETMIRHRMHVGSTNDDHSLTDVTGNRRHLPLSVADVDLEALASIDLEQLWAEAWHRYMQGEKWWPEGNELRIAARAQF